jgi:transposase InsO family protein
MAIEERWNENMRGLIHHSDQGVQSASKEYIESLKSHGILISMAAKQKETAFIPRVPFTDRLRKGGVFK